MKIVSFGDSFVFGAELQDNFKGEKSWAGLIAEKLGVDYETFALTGCGNDYICKQIYSYFSKNPSTDTLAIINWTWASRWDFYLQGEFNSLDLQQIPESIYNSVAGADWPTYKTFLQSATLLDKNIQEEILNFVKSFKSTESGRWFTLGPTCVPENLRWENNDYRSSQVLSFYNTYMRNCILWNNFRNLQSINSAQSYISKKGIKNIQTYMDYELFVDDPLLSPDYIIELQSQIKPNLQLFGNNLNFLDWARENSFKVTSPGDHPLEDAHRAACDLWINKYKEKLFN